MTLAARQRKKKRRAVSGQAYEKPTRTARLAARRLEAGERSTRVGQIRLAVIARARKLCENPMCRRSLVKWGCVLDHWLGGVGRRRQAERLDTTWVLCTRCNEARTANYPTAAFWNERFRIHSMRHGYTFTPHVTRSTVEAAS